MKSPSQMYRGSKNKSKLGAMLNQQPKVKAPSVVPQQAPIEFEYRELSKEEAKELCLPHEDNQRCWNMLTMGAVADIYPSISKAGFNSEVAEAVEIDSKLHIIKGLRRLYCVTHTPGDCVFRVLVSKNMTKQDQFERARTGDIYDSPNILDIGFRLAERYQGRGEGVTMGELAEQEGIALGKVSEAIAFTKFPSYIYGAFPGLRYIRYKWLRYFKKEEDKLSKLEGQLTQVQEGETFDSVHEAEQSAEATFSHIKSLLQEPKVVTVKNKDWEKITPTKGFKVDVKGNDISIKFNTNKVDQDLLTRLEELIKR
ncbi:hypothetical protein [Salinimonas chungwhensis]|uniref:hypothetical protein n=1 Tax=Salinimonas chungwhensis TaxID=265425 RepID=UPI00036A2BF6|nr:hypothetical protein [Salinimonas chungwhensis]